MDISFLASMLIQNLGYHPLNKSGIALRAYTKKDKNIASFTLIFHCKHLQ